MSTAEQIIREYLERGYSLESLRILAESREQPLGGEMLACIDAMGPVAAAEDSGMADVHCETGTYSRVGEDMVFFVADDEPAAAGDDGVDFDLMAETAADSMPAALEESVAEITIGDSSDAEVISFKPGREEKVEVPPTADGDSEEVGIWSRLWSRVAPVGVAPGHCDDAGASGGEHFSALEIRHSEPEAEREAPLFEEFAFEDDAVTEPFEPETAPVGLDIDPVETGRIAPFTSMVVSPDSVLAPVAELDASGRNAVSEGSVDYLPGSVAESYDPDEFAAELSPGGAVDLSLDNEEALEEMGDVAPSGSETGSSPTEFKQTVDEPMGASEMMVEHLIDAAASAEESIVEKTEIHAEEDVEMEPCTTDIQPENVHGGCSGEVLDLDALLSASEKPLPAKLRGSVKASRKERRRVERAEKKKAKRGKKAVAPERVDAAATQAETGENVMADVAVPSGESTLLPAANVQGGTEDEAQVVDTVEECGMSILTPEDVVESFGDGSDSITRCFEKDELQEAVASTDAVSSHIVPAAAAIVSKRLHDALAGLAASSREELVKEREIAKAVKAEQLAEMVDEPVAPETGSDGDHMMIIANGGVGREEVERFLAYDADETNVSDGSSQANIIVFREMFPAFTGEVVDEFDVEEDEASFHPILRMLPCPEPDALAASEETVAEALEHGLVLSATAEEAVRRDAEETFLAGDGAEVEAAAVEPIRRGDILSAEDRLILLDALAGAGQEEYFIESGEIDTAGHAIVSLEPEKESAEALLERESALRIEMEDEYQARLDAFAVRLLEAQAATASSEAKVREKREELDARTAVLAEMRDRLEKEEQKQQALLAELEEARGEARGKEEDMRRLDGLRSEHERLFREFEDLRTAYNEIVTDVMPGLQEERDDLAMTIERQCQKETKLRASLNSSRKRLAVGYSLAAAACLMWIALPVFKWIGSGAEDRRSAVDHQELTQTREMLETKNLENVQAQNRIAELERKVTIARDELARLQTQNRELTDMAMGGQHSQDIAVFRPQATASSNGRPTRVSTMALQDASRPGAPLRVNQVTDPVGSIEEHYAEASRRRDDRRQDEKLGQLGDHLAGANNYGRNIPVSAVARTDSRSTRPQQSQAPAGNSLRPQTVAPGAGSASVASTALDRADVVTAKVRKGEGVAQVVYRVLGSRDPGIIAWVIEENKIRSDRRGNPIIQPNQELKLPKDGKIGQAASLRPRSR